MLCNRCVVACANDKQMSPEVFKCLGWNTLLRSLGPARYSSSDLEADTRAIRTLAVSLHHHVLEALRRDMNAAILRFAQIVKRQNKEKVDDDPEHAQLADAMAVLCRIAQDLAADCTNANESNNTLASYCLSIYSGVTSNARRPSRLLVYFRKQGRLRRSCATLPMLFTQSRTVCRS